MDGWNGMRWDGVDIMLAEWIDGWMDKPNEITVNPTRISLQGEFRVDVWFFFLQYVCVVVAR